MTQSKTKEENIKDISLLELNFKQGEKVKVSPVGDFIGLDGRAFRVDGARIIEQVVKNAIDIPLDRNHNFDEAMGWFNRNSFELRDDGIYANLELTPKGSELVQNKSFRYLSPVYDMNWENRVVMGLDSVGLVNRPNLLNNALNNKEREKMNEELEKLKSENAKLQARIDELAKADTNIQANSAQKDDAVLLTKKMEEMQNSIVELNKKMEVFGKMEHQQEQNNKSLNDAEKNMCAMLGITHEDFIKSKGE